LLDLTVIEGENTFETELWLTEKMYLNTFEFEKDYLVSTASESSVTPDFYILK
jgi:hypothetical protein